MPRADVESVCNHGTAGFGILTNFNLLTAGEHTIQLYVKTVPIGSPVKFTVVKPAGEFLSGAKASATVANFPSAGKSATISWQESLQNFTLNALQ